MHKPTISENQDGNLAEQFGITHFAISLGSKLSVHEMTEQLRTAGIAALERYFDTHGDQIANTEFSEKQIQVNDRFLVVAVANGDPVPPRLQQRHQRRQPDAPTIHTHHSTPGRGLEAGLYAPGFVCKVTACKKQQADRDANSRLQ